MDIKNIEAFICVSNLQNFTKAAEELGYVQSTVTMQIQQLEREIGSPLFDRIGRKVSLTSTGMRFLPYAHEILHIMQKVSTLDKELEEIQGILKVGILESLFFSTMSKILPEFKKRFPYVTVECTIGPSTDLCDALQHNQLDMVFTSDNLDTTPSFSWHYKRKERMIFVANPYHELANKKKVTLEELLEYSFIMPERTGNCYRRLEELAADKRRDVHDTIIVNSVIAIIDLLSHTEGITFLPEYSVASYISQGILSYIHADIEDQYFYSQVLCHKSKWISPFAEYMITLIKDAHHVTVPT